jgi:hypothetical protein
MDEIETDVTAFVGVAFGNNVVYNVVDREGEFEFTGMSIIRLLNNDKNRFIADIIESQSYDGISVILDDGVKFNEYDFPGATNMDLFSDIYTYMREDDNIEYYYIYDVTEDVLIVKTPDEREPVALNYQSGKDVRNFMLYTQN